MGEGWKSDKGPIKYKQFINHDMGAEKSDLHIHSDIFVHPTINRTYQSNNLKIHEDFKQKSRPAYKNKLHTKETFQV